MRVSERVRDRRWEMESRREGKRDRVCVFKIEHEIGRETKI